MVHTAISEFSQRLGHPSNQCLKHLSLVLVIHVFVVVIVVVVVSFLQIFDSFCSFERVRMTTCKNDDRRAAKQTLSNYLNAHHKYTHKNTGLSNTCGG